MCRQSSPLPGPLGAPVLVSSDGASYKSPVAEASVVRDLGNSVAGNVGLLTYDSFVRRFIYEPAAEAISRQGEEFVRRGLMTRGQAAEWVNRSRNALVTATRDSKNTPLGRAIAEYLKPRGQLPSVDDLQAKHLKRFPNASQDEVFEAIIKSGARTRQVVNRASIVLRWSGPALVLVNVGVSAYIVSETPPEERNRAIAREAGGIIGGVGGGWAGAKLGCAGGASIGVIFEGVGALPGCVIGGGLGALGLGWGGSVVGGMAGEAAFDFTQTVLQWVEK